MNHDTMETEIALLKQDALERRRILENLTASQQAQTELIHSMDKKLDTVLARPQCPAIGLCKELEPKLESLIVAQSETTGGKKMLAAMMAAAGAAGGLISYVVGHIAKHP